MITKNKVAYKSLGFSVLLLQGSGNFPRDVLCSIWEFSHNCKKIKWLTKA